MHVLHVVESLEPQAGSVAISLRGLPDALRAHRIESEIVTLDRSDLSSGGAVSTPFDPRAADQLVEKASIVHFHGWPVELARPVASAARKAGKPYVISPLGSLSEGPFNKKGWRDRLRGWLGGNGLVRRAAAITAYNSPEHTALAGAGLNSNVCLLPYGLSVSEYEEPGDCSVELPALPEGRCLLMLGPIHPVEGFVPLLKAFAEIGGDADGWAVVLAGPATGQWRRMLEPAVRRKGGTSRVLLTDAPTVATQRAYLGRASVSASPSLHFRCPVSIMQAVAAGVPVIASDCAAPDGLNGAIHACAPARERIREALRSVFGLSDEDRASMARKAREMGHSLFDWSVLAQQYARLYQGLA